jgi:hypothetical protein
LTASLCSAKCWMDCDFIVGRQGIRRRFNMSSRVYRQ